MFLTAKERETVMEKSSKNLSGEELTLWSRVIELWKCSMEQDVQTIDKAIHPNYTGWDNNSLVPHDRTYAIDSVTDNSVHLIEYKLHPLGVKVYEHRVGIVNYRYQARVQDRQENVRAIKGRWTEIYLQEEQNWTLIGVHGGPEPLKIETSTNVF